MATDDSAPPAPPTPSLGIKKKNIALILLVLAAAWAFAFNTGSIWVLSIVGVLTLILLGIVIWAWRMLRKHKGLANLLQGAAGSAEGRKEALDKLSSGKDANSPVNLFARAQLMAADDGKGALRLIESIDLKAYPPELQDDVSLLKMQLYLADGRTADARKSADFINLDHPQRKQQRPIAASLVAEAWARTGKPKEALALIETIEPPAGKDGEAISLQLKVASIFARFASNQRGVARNELAALAKVDSNQLGRFILPQFRVHPELQQLARQALGATPQARPKMQQGRRR
ncbi:MAG: hypothetical protein KA297_15500 [Kofleriaceae bacterium]|nr:hypothetical protein [Kofleriaceae bacterium]MBP6840456.1 hypothetical protein [Kofleriaceae bacterium]